MNPTITPWRGEGKILPLALGTGQGVPQLPLVSYPSAATLPNERDRRQAPLPKLPTPPAQGLHPSTHCFCTPVRDDRAHATEKIIISDAPQIIRFSFLGYRSACRAAFHLSSGPGTSLPSRLSPEPRSKRQQDVGACPVPQPPRLPAPARSARGERAHPGPPWDWVVFGVGRTSAGCGSVPQLAAGKGLCEGSDPRAGSRSLPTQPCSQFLKPGFAPLKASVYP